MADTRDLLLAWCERGSESAFRELVERYVDLVYSVARRAIGKDSHLVEDAVQKVFVDLALQARHKRGPLTRSTCALGGWLHRHTLFVAANMLRGEKRRQAREHTAAIMNSPEPTDESAWEELAPIFDDTLNELEPDDREALILRFYERRDLRSVGTALGVSEDATQKRVTRAINKLRELLVARGVMLSMVILAGLLEERAVEGAPPALAARAASAAVAARTGIGVALLGHILTSVKTQVAVGLALVGLVAVSFVWYSLHRVYLAADVGNEPRPAESGRRPSAVATVTSQEPAAVRVAANAATASGEAPASLELTILSALTDQPVPNVIVHLYVRQNQLFRKEKASKHLQRYL